MNPLVLVTIATENNREISRSLLLAHNKEESGDHFHWMMTGDLFENHIEIQTDGNVVLHRDNDRTEDELLSNLLELIVHVVSDPNNRNYAELSNPDRDSIPVTDIEVFKKYLYDANPKYPLAIKEVAPQSTYEFYDYLQMFIDDWEYPSHFFRSLAEEKEMTNLQLMYYLRIHDYNEAVKFYTEAQAL